ncbi:MAG: hypothetical protein R6W81_00655 [Bacteroidales bacterium]
MGYPAECVKAGELHNALTAGLKDVVGRGVACNALTAIILQLLLQRRL